MAYFERFVHSLSRLCDRIAQCAVVAMMLIISANIVLRLFWRPIYGTYDVVTLLGSIVVAFALGYCAIQRAHIAVEIVMDFFPPRFQAIVGSITGILSVGLFGIITWQCGVYGADMWKRGEVTMSVYIPIHPFIFGVGFGCAVLCMVCIVDLVSALDRAVKR